MNIANRARSVGPAVQLSGQLEVEHLLSIFRVVKKEPILIVAVQILQPKNLIFLRHVTYRVCCTVLLNCAALFRVFQHAALYTPPTSA
jgi:hypothetical protein